MNPPVGVRRNHKLNQSPSARDVAKYRLDDLERLSRVFGESRVCFLSARVEGAPDRAARRDFGSAEIAQQDPTIGAWRAFTNRRTHSPLRDHEERAFGACFDSLRWIEPVAFARERIEGKADASARPGRVLSSLWLALPRGPVDNAAKRSAPDRRRVRIPLLQPTTRGVFARVEYLIRPARITDIERLVALSGESVRSPGAAGGSRTTCRPGSEPSWAWAPPTP